MTEPAVEKCDCCAQYRTCTERICDRCWRDECRDAQRERDRLAAALDAVHGGEPRALLAELDEARRERDEARDLVRRLAEVIDDAHAADCSARYNEQIPGAYRCRCDQATRAALLSEVKTFTHGKE